MNGSYLGTIRRLIQGVWGMRTIKRSYLANCMVLSMNGGAQYGPQYTIVLFAGIPKKVPLMLGNPHIGLRVSFGKPQAHLNPKP